MNTDKIVEALLGAPVSPIARETAAPLVEAWVAHFYERDRGFKVLAVETPFFAWLDKWTLLVGVVDLLGKGQIRKDVEGVFGAEWKTTREPSKWWNEDRWFKELSTGPQPLLYALAQNKATFVTPQGQWKPKIQPPLFVLLRAAVKSNPPDFWPKERSGVLEFSQADVDSATSAVLNKAETVRALRRSGLLPWQLPGHHCFNWNRECAFFADYCNKRIHPTTAAPGLIEPTDPAAQVLSAAGINSLDTDPRLVVFSASAYSTASECLEKFRITSQGIGAEEQQLAPSIGTAFHRGVGQFYRELQEEQDGGQ